MTNYKEILRLFAQGISQRDIAVSLSHSRNTISKVLQAATQHDVKWPIPETISNVEIKRRLFPVEDIREERRMPDFDYIHKELSRSGVTLLLLWYEYCEKCSLNKTIPFHYTHFCRLYKQYAHQTKATMRIQHKPAEKLEVDWSGQPAYLTNNINGNPIKVYVFVAVLPYSGYTYVEAFLNMKMQNWIQAHINCYEYMGGVARILVPDNLKTGITQVSRSESVINKTYNDLASYYGTVVIPARVRHPKDKASAEGAVGKISTWIIAALRNRQFFTLNDLNKAIKEKLKDFNTKPFQIKDGSRESVFLQEEQELLLPLPRESYEISTWSTATVAYNYHIQVDKRYYSVPYEYIHQKVDVRITDRMIEIYSQGERIALHQRIDKDNNRYQTSFKHMPKKHQEYHKWDAHRFIKWGQSIGPCTEKTIQSVLSSCSVEQQGYRTCMAILSIEKKNGAEKLENACMRALVYTPNPSLKILKTIIKSDSQRIDNNHDKDNGSDSEYAIKRELGYYGGNENE